MPGENPDQLHGVLPVLQTPFTEKGEIDQETLKREIDWAFEVGSDGVVIAMVSEILRLGDRGRKELATTVSQLVQRRGQFVVSVGAECTTDAVQFAEHAQAIGATAVMAIPPVATSLGSSATEAYFAAIASSVSIPLVVQDASSYVGAAIDLAVYHGLLERFGPHRIYFKPEAKPLGPNLSRLRDSTAGQARIFEGSGGINLVDCYRRGIVGTMPAVDLLDGIIALWRALEANDERRIYQLAMPICMIVSMQLQSGLDGFLAIEKYLLKKRGLFKNTFQRQPVAWQMDAETQSEVDRLFECLMQAIKSP